jgi:outer membrane receptor for ferric coprogen and ferric-rhodotorulic acid
MFPHNKITLLISASLVSAIYPAFAQPTEPDTTELSTVVVTEQADTAVTEGSKAYTTPVTDSATKFKLSSKQTFPEPWPD